MRVRSVTEAFWNLEPGTHPCSDRRSALAWCKEWQGTKFEYLVDKVRDALVQVASYSNRKDAVDSRPMGVIHLTGFPTANP